MFLIKASAAQTLTSLELSYRDAIELAIRNNRDIKSAYLNRLSDQFSLHVARDLFKPDLTLVTDTQTARTGKSPLRTDDESLGVSLEAATLIPTGGQVSVSYGANTQRSRIIGFSNTEQFTATNVTLSFIQPLLRGGGFKVARSSLTQAEINERQQVLALKSILIDTVTNTLFAYRQYLLEQRQLAITERSLERSRELVSTTRALIKAGRLAELDLIQAETTLSQRELDLEGARNNTDAARLSLINILDIDLDTQIILMDKLEFDAEVEPSFEAAYKATLNQQPAYLQTLLGIERADIDLIVARNNRLWNLDAEIIMSSADSGSGGLESNFNGAFTDKPNVQAGLRLTIPIGDRSRRQGIANAHIAKRQQELNIVEQLDSIRISLQDQLRSIKSLRSQVSLAKRTEELTHRQLDLEKIKLNLGRTTNFQVTEFEDVLISAQLNTASITASYLNAVTILDQFIGKTLDTWRIPFQIQRYEYHDIQSKKSFQNSSKVN